MSRSPLLDTVFLFPAATHSRVVLVLARACVALAKVGRAVAELERHVLPAANPLDGVHALRVRPARDVIVAKDGLEGERRLEREAELLEGRGEGGLS